MLISLIFNKDDMNIFVEKFLSNFDTKDADSSWAYNKLHESINDIDKVVEMIEKNPHSYLTEYVTNLYENKKLYVRLLSTINLAEEHHRKEILAICTKIKELCA